MGRSVLAAFVLLAACGAGTAPPSTGGALHATPTRQEVVSAMVGVSAPVGACGEGGAVTMEIELAPDGSVRSAAARAPDPSATVREIDVRGTPVEACMVAAIGAARVAPFARDTFRFGFPFVLRR